MTPLAELFALAKAGETGEFLCVQRDVEAHVYLEKGRVAWATSSAAARRFARELERRGVERETLRAVFEHCRAHRTPLGQTLVTWGAASVEVVRQALLSQIEDALITLASGPEGRTLFLRRVEGPEEYDRRFTFDLADAIPGAHHQRAAPESSLLARIRAACPELLWVAERRHPQPTAPRDHEPRIAALVERALEASADFIALRGGDQTIVGLTLEPGLHDLWLGLPATANLGAVVATLGDQARQPSIPPARRSALPVEGPTAFEPPSGSWRRVVDDTLERFRELECVVVAGDGTPSCASRAPDASASAIRVGREHRWILEHEGSDARLVLGIDALWWFAARVAAANATLWLAIDRAAGQGVGWALLAAMVRSLELPENRA